MEKSQKNKKYHEKFKKKKFFDNMGVFGSS